MVQVITLIWLMMTMTRSSTDSHRNTITPVTRRREKQAATKDEKSADMRAKNRNATNRTKRNGVRKHSRTELKSKAIVLPMMNFC